MFIGACESPQSMTSGFVDVIIRSFEAVAPHRVAPRRVAPGIGAGDVAGMMVGRPVPPIDARRGCPGALDDPGCRRDLPIDALDRAIGMRVAETFDRTSCAPTPGVEIDPRCSIRVMGRDHLMGSIDFLGRSGRLRASEDDCTRRRGNVGTAFAAARQPVLRFGPAQRAKAIDPPAPAPSPSGG